VALPRPGRHEPEAPSGRHAIRIDEDEVGVDEDAVVEDAAPRYPIPPAPPVDVDETRADDVPIWAVRRPAPAPSAASAPESTGDLPLDPMALRRRVTVRAGGSTLTVDDHGLLLRPWWRRRIQIPWSEVDGFELRRSGSRARAGRLVVRTGRARVPLPATRRSAADLRQLHALLDAYRRRAELLSGG
jgi:hypothetical protein